MSATFPNPSKSVSGNVTTYVITDTAGNTLSVAVTVATPNMEFSTAFSGGPLLVDGIRILDALLQLIGTGQLP